MRIVYQLIILIQFLRHTVKFVTEENIKKNVPAFL